MFNLFPSPLDFHYLIHLQSENPELWQRFVQSVNAFLLAIQDFLINFGKIEIMYVAGLAWLLLMWMWVRDTPKLVKFLYFMAFLGLIFSYLIYFLR